MGINNQIFAKRNILTFIAISLFYLFETAQMSYYNVLAPAYLSLNIYQHSSIAAISAAYYYGDMIGLFFIGYLLDRFQPRLSLAIALLGSILGSFLLFASSNIETQYIARFICGFFGGTFSFVGGIRVIAIIFPKRFTYAMSIFLAAGIVGAMLCQYPLLLVVNHFGPKGAMLVMFGIGIIIALFNLLYFHPPLMSSAITEDKKYNGTTWQMLKEITLNLKNWCDVLMVVLLETPGTIIGTLWGIVLTVNFFHCRADTGSWIITAMLLGSCVGLPSWGYFADKKNTPAWMIVLGAIISALLIFMMILLKDAQSSLLIGILFFMLGFSISCQTIGFTWLTKNMKPELIGRNSAFNSIVFMATNGGLKQFSGFLFTVPALFFGDRSAINLLLLILISILIAGFYAVIRPALFPGR